MPSLASESPCRLDSGSVSHRFSSTPLLSGPNVLYFPCCTQQWLQRALAIMYYLEVLGFGYVTVVELAQRQSREARI